MKSITLILCLIAIISLLSPMPLQATVSMRPPVEINQDGSAAAAIELEQVATGLTAPIYVTSARDGSNRLFVVEQAGRIKVISSSFSTPLNVFLDIASKVRYGGERGLLGLAFHPQFATNRRFFVNYTRQPDGATVIAEYRASFFDPNIAEPTETVLLVIPQPFANHNGGMVEFGPDGFLYIGMGDGGSGNDPGNRAQNLNDLLGKILRIDVDHLDGGLPYSSPSDNPFFGPTAGRDEIYAYGLRNPWRFSFDRATGLLYAADVGQGAREEIDIITRGGNYGWRIFEGNRCTGTDAALCNSVQAVPPIAEYDHIGGRCSITGGYVYRGSRGALPTGSYVYGDFCTGEIFLLNGGVTSVLLDTQLNISSFGEDEAGEVYVVGIGGAIYRILGPDAPTPLPFSIVRAAVRHRSSGEILDPVTVKSNAKKYNVVVNEEGFAPNQLSLGARVYVNGIELETTYTTTEVGTPIFVARLQKKMLRQPGSLAIEVVRENGTHSNPITIPILPEQ